MAATTLELSGSATLGDVTKALEGAKTPHASKCPPGVAAAIAAKMSKEEVDKLLEKLQEK